MAGEGKRPGSGPNGQRDNLPAQITSFVGRERAIAEIARLVEAHRLVMLTGAPGVGKTRLALRVAEEVLGQFPDGVWLVELAGLTEPSLVPSVVARTLAVREQGRPLLDALQQDLQHRKLLLVMDNCEHLLDGCASLLEALLLTCAEVRVLATSRQSLNLVGEITWQVPSLSLPERPASFQQGGPGSTPIGLPELQRSEAGRLFVERATAVRPGFVVSPENAPPIAEICRQVDGLPLAIELAAVRVRALSPEQIAARLRDRYAFLAGIGRITPPRHRTLRALVDWSWDLLTEPERVILRRVSTFANGWTLEAAEGVVSGRWPVARGDEATDHWPPTTGPSVLDLLASLVDKCLVVAEERRGGVRYRLLETLRQYAQHRLRESGEEPEVSRRHQRWFLELAERAALQIVGPDAATWLDALEVELDNVRAALAWRRNAPETDRRTALEGALRLGAALAYFWDAGDHLTEGRAWLEELIGAASAERAAGDPPVDDLALGRALVAAGYLTFTAGDAAAAAAQLAEGAARCEAAADGFYLAWGRGQLGAVTLFQGDAERAAGLVGEALAITESRPEWSAYTSAWQYWLGEVEFARGNYERAVVCWERSLEIARRRSLAWGMPYALSGLARVAFRRGDHDLAAGLQAEVLALRREMDTRGTAFSLAELAWARVAQGRAGEGAVLLGAADAGLGRVGVSVVLLPDWHVQHDRAAEAARTRLGRAAFDAAYARGRALPLQEAVSIALDVEQPDRSTTQPSDCGTAERLTRREREIAKLVAAGRTNRQIADELVVSERTVEWHVANILGKLGLQTRAQVAVWAAERGRRLAD